MKIIYLANSIIPSTHANSVHVMRMCNAFSSNGHDTTLIIPMRGHNIWKSSSELHRHYGTDGNFKIVRLPLLFTIIGYHLYWMLSAIYCKLTKPDVIYGRAFFSVYYASKLGLDVHYESHAPENLNTVTYPAFQKLLKSERLKRVVLISDALKKIFVNLHGENDKFYVAHDGADIAKQLNHSKEPEKDQKIKIGYIGHLYKGRGIDIIIEMAKQSPWADFHIIGGNKEIVEQSKKETTSISNIIFHGFQPPNKIAELMSSFGILLAPYQKKVTILGKGNTVDWMSPLKIFEYMASGVPFIASDLPVLKEILEDRRNCLLCVPENADQWVSAIEELRDYPSLAQTIATNGYNDIKNYYSWKVRASNVITNEALRFYSQNLSNNDSSLIN